MWKSWPSAICFLIGALVWLGSTAAMVKGLICIVFILITSSTAAHALSKAAHRSGVKLWDKSVVDRFAEDRKDGTNSEEGMA